MFFVVILGICILIVTNLSVGNAWQSWTENDGNLLVIVMEHDSDPIFPLNLNYAKNNQLRLLHTKVHELNLEMQSPVSNYRTLRIDNGFIATIHLLANLEEVHFENCSVNRVVIDSNLSFQTEYLAITKNKLKEVPKHLNVLKKLEKLYLHDNQIEFIDMVEFNGLNNLKMISIQRNNIIEIKATLQSPVYLPKLKWFIASYNRLVELNFVHWNTSQLNTIYLNGNQLQIALSFPSAFPELKIVKINDNNFNCDWLDAALKELHDRRVTVQSESETTCNKAEPPLDELVREVNLNDTFSTISEFENTTPEPDTCNTKIDLLRKENENLRNELKELLLNMEKSLQSKFDFLLNQIQLLHQKDDDLTESLYLNELERGSYEEKKRKQL